MFRAARSDRIGRYGSGMPWCCRNL